MKNEITAMALGLVLSIIGVGFENSWLLLAGIVLIISQPVVTILNNGKQNENQQN